MMAGWTTRGYVHRTENFDQVFLYLCCYMKYGFESYTPWTTTYTSFSPLPDLLMLALISKKQRVHTVQSIEDGFHLEEMQPAPTQA